jgi:HSP20 family molecular chaperone IbpA
VTTEQRSTATTEDKSADQNKAADSKAERGKAGGIRARGEGSERGEGRGEEAVKRRLRRRILAELFDEDEGPIDQLVQRRLRRRVLGELFDGGPIDQIMRQREVARALWADFTPKADIFEQDGTLVIRVDLPGLQRGDVELTVDEGDLVISGERKVDPMVEDEAYYQDETPHGRFYRRIPLPDEAQLEQIRAEHKDGVLEIRVLMPERPKIALA